MRFVIFDFEVFEQDWVVVFQDIDRARVDCFHNDNQGVREYIKDIRLEPPMLVGFNCKHYDNWILQAVMNGADPETIKRLNDWIIVERRNGWDFPFLQYKKKEFMSMDLRDDLPVGLSLKAIEGNMGQSIVESSVDFKIRGPLTHEQLREVIAYCKTDVQNTAKLLEVRKSYIDSKLQVAATKGMDPAEALSLTNAKLTARFLDAKMQQHDDALVYEVPEELKIGKYTHVLDFFKDPVNYTLAGLKEQLTHATTKIKQKSIQRRIDALEASNDRYECSLETTIAGVPHVYGWGGIHGATKNLILNEDNYHTIVTIDVGSYYPSLMLEYQYTSRNIPSAEGYAEIYHRRMAAKHSGDKATANALKLVLNTCYGAMKNQYNELYDPRMASAICITGQLFLTDLIDKLEEVAGFELIQSNTDGIIIRFPHFMEDQIHERVSEWETRTRMKMEYTVMHAIAQKDVNNYVMKAGETYLVKDGQKVITDPDKGKLKTKGGYVSQSGGGDFKNNSMSVVHDAVVHYFMNGKTPEETIGSCQDVQAFQIIAKSGSTYESTYWINDGEKVQVQKVNRVYASKDPKHGKIYKVKGGQTTDADVVDAGEAGEKIANLPEHCYIDNENKMRLENIDMGFYINEAKKRISDYIGAPYQEPERKKDMSSKNIYAKLIEARQRFLQTEIKKTGINRFAGFKYFELADIVPPATAIFKDLGLVFLPTFDETCAIGTLVNTEAPEEKIEFKSPMRALSIVSQEGKNKMNELQGLGAEQTYQRRYLYMMALDIVEADAFDATSGSEDGKPIPAAKTSNRPAAPEEREEIKKELVAADKPMDKLQEKSMKEGLKKLKDKDPEALNYINEVVLKMKEGMTKKEAEAVLIEISDKLNG